MNLRFPVFQSVFLWVKCCPFIFTPSTPPIVDSGYRIDFLMTHCAFEGNIVFLNIHGHIAHLFLLSTNHDFSSVP